jgi:hypothetical protein
MAITSLFGGAVFDSHEAEVIAAAFEEVINRLSIARGSDPVREELIARKIIAAAKRGPVEQRRLVRETLSA